MSNEVAYSRMSELKCNRAKACFCAYSPLPAISTALFCSETQHPDNLRVALTSRRLVCSSRQTKRGVHKDTFTILGASSTFLATRGKKVTPRPSIDHFFEGGSNESSTVTGRRDSIAGSPKPRMHVIDLVDNCGKHKVRIAGSWV